MMDYDVVIGIETHIQLKTATKMFCRCSADFFGQPPNIHTCPTCLGLPGALPMINKKALDQAMLMGLALHASIADTAHFDRKNYFYPDLAKGYQITQYDEPLNNGGWVEVNGRQIGIIRAHLEEDVGKLTHSEQQSLVDFNKAGLPLLEVVSEPVLGSAAEAKAYVQQLRQIARYLDVNEGNLEKGTMRADVNVSLQDPGKWRYGNGAFSLSDGYSLHKRVEIKNVNSFRAIERAVEYEIERQLALLASGREVEQETRGWDEGKGVTTSQRGKEEAHDYRYFPEPDLPPLHVDENWKAKVATYLPELPADKLARFGRQYSLNDYDARLLTEDRPVADWFEAAVASSQPLDISAKTVANWMTGELSRLQNEHQLSVAESQLLPAQLATVLKMLHDQHISAASAKQIVAEIFVSGKDARGLVDQLGLQQVAGDAVLLPIVKQVLATHADAVANYKNGKVASLMFLVGQVMKETQGRAKPDVVKDLLIRQLE